MELAAYLKRWFKTVHVVASVAAVTEQHLLGVSLPATDPAARVEGGLAPQDAPLQGGQVQEHLGEAGSGHQRLLPALKQRLLHLR